MRENYVTHFNSGYLLHGVALYLSMARQLDDFILWVVCLDAATSESLKRLNLPYLNVIEQREWETEQLLELRRERSFREYCWTITPSVPKFVFNTDSSINRVTYLDADVWFRKDPKSIFNEFEKSNKSILITDHHYAPQFDQSKTSGQYCVQFIIFVRNNSELVRSSWESQCRDWCYAYHEEGKFGDQKYLENWPSNFENDVHVLKNQTAILASWNATRFPYSNAIIWHFHGVTIARQGKKIVVDYGYHPIPDVAIENVFDEYTKDLERVVEIFGEEVISYLPQRRLRVRDYLKNHIKRSYYRILRLSCHKIVKLKDTL